MYKFNEVRSINIACPVEEVYELESNCRIAYQTLKNDSMHSFGFYQFDSIPQGTQLTLNFILAPRGIMKLIVPLLAGKLKRDITAGLQSIKAVLEKQP